MPRIVDDLIADPPDFAPGRTPLDLGGVGLSVVEARWGEAAVEAALIKQKLGDAVVDRRLPDKESILKLKVKGEGEVDLATVAAMLEAKVGLWQREGGWLQRDFQVGGNFGSLACEVKKATLGDIGGWQRGESPDVTLALVTGPLWYSTEEIESEVFDEEASRSLIFELAEVLGTAPGLLRLRVNNLGEDHWRGLFFAAESRDHPQDETKDTTAALEYEAVDLTPLGGAAAAEREGEDVISHTSLSNLWQAILGSEIDGVGHMTHVGERRVLARIYDPGSVAGRVQLRLEWRALGGSQWEQNAIVPTPLIDDFAVIDLGSCRPERAARGDQRWEWRLTARTTHTPGADIDVQLVKVPPTEQFAVLRAPVTMVTPTLFEAREEFNQSAGNLDGKALPDGSGNWDTDTLELGEEGEAEEGFEDFKTTGKGWMERVADDFAGGGGGRRAVPPVGLSPTIAAQLTWEWADIPDATIQIVSTLGWGFGIGMTATWEQSLGQVKTGFGFFGGGGISYPFQPNVPYTFTLIVIDGFAYGWITSNGKPASGQAQFVKRANTPEAQVQITDFCQLEEATRRYLDFAIWTPELGDALAFPGRAIELCSDGVFSQHQEDDVWKRIIPEGFLPYAPASGLEARAMRCMVVPTQGDLDTLTDDGANPLSAQAFYRPAYYVSREALSGP